VRLPALRSAEGSAVGLLVLGSYHLLPSVSMLAERDELLSNGSRLT